MTNPRETPDAAPRGADGPTPEWPHGPPVYHGFVIVPETCTGGWCLGVMSDIGGSEGSLSGDAFVVAPDGTRADLLWEVGEGAVQEVLPPDAGRWGVYAVAFPGPVRGNEDLRRGFHAVLPELQAIHARVTGTGGR